MVIYLCDTLNNLIYQNLSNSNDLLQYIKIYTNYLEGMIITWNKITQTEHKLLDDYTIWKSSKDFSDELNEKLLPLLKVYYNKLCSLNLDVDKQFDNEIIQKELHNFDLIEKYKWFNFDFTLNQQLQQIDLYFLDFNHIKNLVQQELKT